MEKGTSLKRIAIPLSCFLLCVIWMGVYETKKIAAVGSTSAEIGQTLSDESADASAILLPSKGVSVNGRVAYSRATLPEESRISTTVEGASLSLGSAGRMSIDPQSELILTRRGKDLLLKLSRGNAQFWSSSAQPVNLQVATSHGDFAVSSPKGSRLVLASFEDPARLPVISAEKALGNVSVSLPNGRVEYVTMGQAARIDARAGELTAVAGSSQDRSQETLELIRLSAMDSLFPSAARKADSPVLNPNADSGGVLLPPVSPTRP